MGKLFSQKEKIKIWEQLVERDGGYHCFYCNKPFTEERPILEHLNDSRNDNRLDNLVLSCQSCNIKKIKDPILDELSFSKLEMNENQIYVGEKNLKKITSKKSDYQNGSKEIEINEKNYDLTKNYISDRVSSWESVEFKDVLDSCVYLCKETTGHGSHQSVRNYISTITSTMGPFEIIKNDQRKKVIVKRV